MHGDAIVVFDSGVNSLINKMFKYELATDAKHRKILLLLFEWASRSLVSKRPLFTYTCFVRKQKQDRATVNTLY